MDDVKLRELVKEARSQAVNSDHCGQDRKLFEELARALAETAQQRDHWKRLVEAPVDTDKIAFVEVYIENETNDTLPCGTCSREEAQRRIAKAKDLRDEMMRPKGGEEPAPTWSAGLDEAIAHASRYLETERKRTGRSRAVHPSVFGAIGYVLAWVDQQRRSKP